MSLRARCTRCSLEEMRRRCGTEAGAPTPYTMTFTPPFRGEEHCVLFPRLGVPPRRDDNRNYANGACSWTIWVLGMHAAPDVGHACGDDAEAGAPATSTARPCLELQRARRWYRSSHALCGRLPSLMLDEGTQLDGRRTAHGGWPDCPQLAQPPSSRLL